MANIITQNPLILDTTATVAFTRPILAKRIEWVGATAIGQVSSVSDINGNVICKQTSGATVTGIVMWAGPQKLTLPGKQASFAGAGNPNGSWQVTVASGQILIWY